LAESAFSVDRGFYSPREHNWPVLANQGSSVMSTWCAGRPGILLARAYAWQLSREARLLTEVQDGLKHFRSSPMGTDHWCCGSLGNAEILRSLADIIGQPEFAEHSVELIGKVVHRASQ
jgi:lantibiotic modifying enzyme